MARPDKLTPEGHAAIIKADDIDISTTGTEISKRIKSGLDTRQACESIGLPYAVFEAWMDTGAVRGSGAVYRVFFLEILSAMDARIRQSAAFNERPAKDFGYVYLLRDSLLGAVKIGYAATDYKRRVKALQSGCPQEINLIAIIQDKDASRIERELHRKYKGQSLRGEWFLLSDSDIDDIVNYYGGKYLWHDQAH